MSVDFNQIVQSMSQVFIPQEILNKVDMSKLLKGLSDDYKRLGNLKEVRNRHEGRNFVSRWWNNNELEDAQLDAAELQASFSKKLGQLMVISVAQSQQLNQQQHALSAQQGSIKQQTEQLAKNDEYLKEQQLNLERQNEKLEKLVKEYFELKGLTQDGALKLIKIANEVKESKDSLMRIFENHVQKINEDHQNILAEQADFACHQMQKLNIFQSEAKQHLDIHQQQIEQRINQVLQQIFQTNEQTHKVLSTTEQRISDTLSYALEQQKQQQAGYDQLWQSDKSQVLECLAQHQKNWEVEAQGQVNKLDILQANYVQLQHQIGEKEQQNLRKLENLYQLLDILKLESQQRELNWRQRWKIMVRSVTLTLLLLFVALLYLIYSGYHHLPIF